MMKASFSAMVCAGLLIALPANAAQYVYPLQGQDPAKQANDEADCSSLAAQQAGIEPGAQASYGPDGAPTGTAGDASASAPLVLGAISGGQQGGAAGALSGGGPGQAGTATDALVSNAGGVGGKEGVAVGAGGAGSAVPSGFDKARADCLTARGYSVH